MTQFANARWAESLGRALAKVAKAQRYYLEDLNGWRRFDHEETRSRVKHLIRSDPTEAALPNA